MRTSCWTVTTDAEGDLLVDGHSPKMMGGTFLVPWGVCAKGQVYLERRPDGHPQAVLDGKLVETYLLRRERTFHITCEQGSWCVEDVDAGAPAFMGESPILCVVVEGVYA